MSSTLSLIASKGLGKMVSPPSNQLGKHDPQQISVTSLGKQNKENIAPYFEGNSANSPLTPSQNPSLSNEGDHLPLGTFGNVLSAPSSSNAHEVELNSTINNGMEEFAHKKTPFSAKSWAKESEIEDLQEASYFPESVANGKDDDDHHTNVSSTIEARNLLYGDCVDLSSKLMDPISKHCNHQELPSVTAHHMLDESSTRATRDKETAAREELNKNNVFKGLCDDIIKTRKIYGDGSVSKHQNSSDKGIYSLASKTPWSAIVGKPFSPTKLEYVPPSRSTQGNKLKLPDELTQLGVEKWQHSLVGYFLAKTLPFSIVKEQANRLWHKYGLIDTLSSEKGIYVFRFENALGCNNVLNRGPWLVGGQPMRLQLWSKEIDVSKDNLKSMEIWTKLYNIPLVYWIKEGLSAIASWLGKPLILDEPTEKTQRISFARVCIDIPIESEFPSSFLVESDMGKDFEVRVEYSWIPKKCTICNAFGHNKTSYPKAVWRPKPQPVKESFTTLMDNRVEVSPKRKQADCDSIVGGNSTVGSGNEIGRLFPKKKYRRRLIMKYRKVRRWKSRIASSSLKLKACNLIH